MSEEEDLELLITVDEPWDGHEDTFNHQDANTVGYRPGQPLPTKRRPDQRTEVSVDDDSPKLTG